MKNKLTIAVITAVFLSLMIQVGSKAQTSTSEEIKWHAPAPGAVTVARKLTFKDKHPVAYRRFRKARHACVLLAPFINVTANCFTAVGVFL